MSTLSQPTSSSYRPSPPVGCRSSPVGHSSSTSSSSFSSSSSSTTDSLSIGVADVPLQVEVVRGDDPANVVDMYTCLFSDLHVSQPFDKFTMGVLRTLNVAPTQIHPNT